MNPPVQNLYIERVRPENLSQVLSIAFDGGMRSWMVEDYAAELERSDSVFLVAHAEGSEEVLGFIVGRIVPGPEEDAYAAEIHNIGVSKIRREKGIGNRLLKDFINRCRLKQVREIWLEVRTSNTIGIKFYEKNGFTVEYIRKGYYREPYDDANIMHSTV